MKYTVVLPYIYEPYKVECLETCKLENILLVDNTVKNKGIMRSHNMGIDKMREDGSDWLIVLSAAIRFGKPGGLDFVKALEARHDDLVVEAAGVYGWHLIAFSKKVIETVGKWDENFSPYGFDDLDYSWRIQKAFGLDDRSRLWQKVVIDVEDAGMGHSIHKAGVTSDVNGLMEYYRRKWGVRPGTPHDRAYSKPFNSADDIGYWPRAASGAVWSSKGVV